LADAPQNAFGRAFLHDARGAAALGRLARYEVSIDRAFYRAMHELQSLQAARASLKPKLQNDLTEGLTPEDIAA